MIELWGERCALKTYQTQFADFKIISEKLSVIKLQKENALKELDYNAFLYNELQQAGLKKLNQQELEETYETLNNAEAIQEALSHVNKLLEEDSNWQFAGRQRRRRIVLGE